MPYVNIKPKKKTGLKFLAVDVCQRKHLQEMGESLISMSDLSWGGAHPKKNQKKPKKTKPIYQLWCSDWFFLVFFGFFLVFFGFFWFILVFFGIFWDDILTLNLNTKKNQKIPKKTKKKPKKNQIPISNVGQGLCQKNQKKPKKPKKTKKNQKKPVSNFEFWPKPMPKKTKKNQKKPKKTNANLEI